MLESMGEEGTFRLENIEELKTSILTYQNEAEEASLGGFLEEISLYTDVDKYEPDQDTVMLMTVHSAKGLEFRNVFLVGMEQGVFPGNRSLSTPQDLEEERRLAYVALTRDYCCQPYAVWYDHAKSTLAVSGRNRQVTAGRKNFPAAVQAGDSGRQCGVCAIYFFVAAASGCVQETGVSGTTQGISRR